MFGGGEQHPNRCSTGPVFAGGWLCRFKRERSLETSQRTQNDFVFSRFDASAGGTGMVPKWSLILNLRRFLYHLSNTAEREIREREYVGLWFDEAEIQSL